jgi:alpha,alpha-trehalose phosphorylase
VSDYVQSPDDYVQGDDYVQILDDEERPLPKYEVEPWAVREKNLDLEQLPWSESIFALSNGHIGLRGNLDEGEPHGLPGTYLNSFYELRPLPYAEAGYGFPESGQSIVNVINGKPIRLLVDDEPFDVRYGDLRSHERVLDLRAGTLHRELEWASPAGDAVRVNSTRLVSFTHRAIAAICYEVEAVDETLRLIVQSELVANEQLPTTRADPRVEKALEAPLVSEEHLVTGTSGGLLVHQTRASGLRMAAAMDHVVEAPGKVDVKTESFPDWVRTTVACVLKPGEKLRIVKMVAYGWSSRRSLPALRDQVGAALTSARYAGWDGLCREQREYLDVFWDASDVQLDGDAEIQQAVRLALFHLLQSGARSENRSIPAKGLSGPGYDGHIFWDTEMFMLPALTYTQPAVVAHVLRWRQSTLDLAKDRAQTLGLKGAAFPWRTVRGQECSAYWPAGTAAFHNNAAIAAAVTRYVNATGDDDFERDTGLELLVETARLWHSLGHHDRHGKFHIDGVTGPDEYTAIVNDNLYTNLMAQRNLVHAAEAAGRHPEKAAELEVSDDETKAWRVAAAAMHLPYDEELRVHQQHEGFTRLQEWDFENTPSEKYPLLLNFPYFDIYRKKVSKQPDLVLALHWCGDSFTFEEKQRNFVHYEQFTVRDSSLSACTLSVLAAEVGYLKLAHDYLAEAALVDLHDLAGNTSDGLHVAALAGSWLALVCGFGGMRDHGGQLSFAPRLPEHLERMEFSLLWRGLRLRLEVRPNEVTYSLRNGTDGSTLPIRHHGEPVTITSSQPTVMPIPPLPQDRPAVHQPHGRAPVKRAPR